MADQTGQQKIFIPGDAHPKPKFFFLFFKYLVTDFFLPGIKVKKEPITVDPGEIKVWMIGHATTLINFYGTTILTDPIFYGLTMTRRLHPIGYKISELPKIDFVLLSHAHMDHFNIKSLRKLANAETTLIIPRNCTDLVHGMRYKQIIEAQTEKPIHLSGLQIIPYQSLHWGERYPWQKKDRGYNSYIIKSTAKTIFFGGDTGYVPGVFKKIAAHKIDLALLPIGAYYPWNDFNKIHMDPKEAIQAFEEMEAKYFVPIHWGTFRLSYEPMDEPPKWLTRLAAEKNIPDRVKILYNGQSFTLPS